MNHSPATHGFIAQVEQGNRRHQPSYYTLSMSHFEHSLFPFRVAYAYPLCANISSSRKPEVHIASQRH